jgi:hypothetical protein
MTLARPAQSYMEKDDDGCERSVEMAAFRKHD